MMKKTLSLSFIIIFFLACGSDDQGSEGWGKSKDADYWERLEMVEVIDADGQVAAIMPFPTTWQRFPVSLEEDGISIKGPHNIQVTEIRGNSYTDIPDPYYRNLWEQSGSVVRPLIPDNDVIQQDFIPMIQSRGYRYIKHEEVPEMSEVIRWYRAQLYGSDRFRNITNIYAIDLEDQNGNPAVAFFTVSSAVSPSISTWYYSTSLLEANPDAFERAKKQYVFSSSNVRFNLGPIMTYNQREAMKDRASWGAFNRRMAANQAAFEARQRDFTNRSNAINDAIMSGWKSQSEYSDRSHADFLDYINERQNVQNVESGDQYKVDYGYNQYWMNADGDYIATESSTYNPNLDENFNRQNWKELKKIR